MSYKKRLVAKGFSQVTGRDYNHTYSTTTGLKIIKIFISYALCRDSALKQMTLNADRYAAS